MKRIQTLKRNTILSILLFTAATYGCSKSNYVQIDIVEEPIHLAAANGDIDKVRQLLDSGIDVNILNSIKETPLHYAARQGQYETAKLLIDRGANVNAGARFKYRPLHYAAHGQFETARLLIDRGAKVNVATTYHKYRPMHIAAGLWNKCYARERVSPGHRDTIKLLISAGADIDPKERYGTTPLQIAASCNAVVIAKILIDHGADVNHRAQQYSVLESAIFWSNDIAFLLMDRGAKADKNMKPIMITGTSPLMIAIIKQNVELVREVLQTEADVNQKQPLTYDTPLGRAVSIENIKIVELLLKYGADLNAITGRQYVTPIYIAADKNNFEIAQVLLENGADPNISTDEGLTPLHLAAKYDNASMVDILLSHNADSSIIYLPNGKAPRDMATKSEVIELFGKFKKAKIQ